MKTFQGHKLKALMIAGLLLLSRLNLAQTIPDYVGSALASTERTAEMKARDPARKPAEVLALAGVKPSDTVVEFAGFGLYYTTILSALVGPEGKVHMFDLPYTEERNGAAGHAFITAHPNTTYTIVDYNAIELPANVDVVMNMQYYHDLSLNKIDTAVLNGKIFDALKPGGIFIIEDHNAEAGSGTRDTESLHRIDPDVIKQEVLAAGFVLAEESGLLASQTDDYTQSVFAPDTRGATDRSLFKFVKP